MDWTAPIEIYRERTGPYFRAETANSITNLAFLIAAIVAEVMAPRAGLRQRALIAPASQICIAVLLRAGLGEATGALNGSE